MTIEIAILNSYAVAIAADSATTILNRDKTSDMVHHASKLFVLAKDVAAMFYGLRDLYNVPWETLIKLYRQDSGEKGTLKEYAEDFIAFLERHLHLFPPDLQKTSFLDYIHLFFTDLAKELAHQGIHKDAAAQIETAIKTFIEEEGLSDNWEARACPAAELIPGLQVTYNTAIDEVIDETFEGISLTALTRHTLKEAALRDFFSPEDTLQFSGIVVAGFGRDDVFPGICEIAIKGVLNDRLVYKFRFAASIGHNNDAIIRNYAVREPVLSFLSGVTSEFQDFAVDSLFRFEGFSKFLEKTIQGLKGRTPGEESSVPLLERVLATYDALSESYLMAHYRRRTKVISHHWHQILLNTASLPKAELATFAETLLHLTFFKGRGTRSPIDVAVISKGDGFEWLIQEGKRV